MQGSAACATALVFGGDWVPIFPGGTLSSLQMLPDAHIAGKSDRPVVYLHTALSHIMLLDKPFVVRCRYRGMRRLLYILAPFFLEPQGCTFGVMSPCIPNLSTSFLRRPETCNLLPTYAQCLCLQKGHHTTLASVLVKVRMASQETSWGTRRQRRQPLKVGGG